MKEKIYLEMLSQDSVSVKKQQVILGQDSKEYETGLPWRRAYVNSVRGRQQVSEEVPEPYRSAIFAVWGDTPTVNEDIQNA